MKKLFLIFAMMISSSANAQSMCSDPIQNQQLCQLMKNLSSHVSMLDAQRDLVQVNYPYLKEVSKSMQAVALEARKNLPANQADHDEALWNLADQAGLASMQAAAGSPEVFVTTNALKVNCSTCHKVGATGGKGWNDIITIDWNKVVSSCNGSDHNPFLCKQMNGMVSNFNYVLTAYVAKIENFRMIEQVGRELNRISSILIDNKMFHSSEEPIRNVNKESLEVAEAALRRDPNVFAKAYSISQNCTQCHSTGKETQGIQALDLSLWRKGH